jgi:predicted DNA-binding protein
MPEAAAAEGRRQIQMSVRVPVELAEALEQVAEREDRTVSAELRRIIRRHVCEAREAMPRLEEAA